MRATRLLRVAPALSFTPLTVTRTCCALGTPVRFTVSWFAAGPAVTVPLPDGETSTLAVAGTLWVGGGGEINRGLPMGGATPRRAKPGGAARGTMISRESAPGVC